MLQPVTYDAAFTSTTVFWFQQLSVYRNSKASRTGSLDEAEISKALKGCPEWVGVDNNGDGELDSDKIGYGMSRRLRMPESCTRYHVSSSPLIPVTAPGGIKGPKATNNP